MVFWFTTLVYNIYEFTLYNLDVFYLVYIYIIDFYVIIISSNYIYIFISIVNLYNNYSDISVID